MISQTSLAGERRAGRAVCAALLAQVAMASSARADLPPEPPSTPDNRSIVYMNETLSNTLPAKQHSYMVRELETARETYASFSPGWRRALIKNHMTRARARMVTTQFDEAPDISDNFVTGTVSNYISSVPFVGAPVASAFDTWREAQRIQDAKTQSEENTARAKAVPANETAIWNSHWDIVLRHRPEEYPGMNEDMKIPGYHEDPKQDPLFHVAQRFDQYENKQDALLAIVKQVQDRGERMKLMMSLIARHPELTDEMKETIKKEVEAYGKLALDQTAAAAKETAAGLKKLDDAQKARDEREAKQRRESDQRENLAGGFMAAQNLALILGEPKAARFFGQAGVIADSVFQISKATKTMKLEQPFKYANLYLLAASTLLQMFGPSQDAQVMEALRSLGKQLEDLRLEMRESFAELNLKVDRYHLETRLDLQRLAETQARIQQALAAVSRDIKNFRTDWENATDQQASNELSLLGGECLGSNFDGSSFRIDSRSLANKCLGTYTTVGSGSFSMVLKHDDATKPSPARSDFPKLAARVRTHSRREPISVNATENFDFGANKLLAVLDRNPNLIPMAKTSVWDVKKAKYTLNNLIRVGTSIDKFNETMALEQKGKGYGLRRGIFDDLLRDYRTVAEDVAQEYRRGIDANLKGLPTSSIDWTKSPPPPNPESRSPLVKQGRVSVCSTTPHKLQPVDWPGSDKIEPEDLKQRRLRKVFEIGGDGLRLSPAFLKYLPPAIRWADLVETDGRGVKPYQVQACFNKAKVLFGDGHYSRVAEMELELDFYVTDMKSAHPQPKLVARVAGKDWFAAWGYKVEDQSHLINMIWESQPISGEDRFSYGKDKWQTQKDYANLQDQPERFFKSVAVPEIAENLKLIESSVRSNVEKREKETFNSTLGALDAKLGELDSIRWQLDHLLREGVDMRDARMAGLYEMILRKTLPTGEAFLREVEAAAPGRELDRLDADLASVDKLLEAYALVEDLRPAVSPIEPTIKRLEELRDAPPKSWWRRWFDRS